MIPDPDDRPVHHRPHAGRPRPPSSGGAARARARAAAAEQDPFSVRARPPRRPPPPRRRRAKDRATASSRLLAGLRPRLRGGALRAARPRGDARARRAGAERWRARAARCRRPADAGRGVPHGRGPRLALAGRPPSLARRDRARDRHRPGVARGEGPGLERRRTGTPPPRREPARSRPPLRLPRHLHHRPRREREAAAPPARRRRPRGVLGRRPPRPRVTVSVGERKPSALGLDALLDFSVRLTLGDEEITEAELRKLREGSEGLVLLKGRWVEVDREKLDEVLRRWKEAQRSAGDGLSFIEAMRLVAGADLADGKPEAEADREWAGGKAGAWPSETLADLRGARGGCLADDMGLGKPIQVLALLLLLKRHRAIPGPHLLVVPASLLANWKAEAERFAPSVRVLVAHPSATPREELAALGPETLAEHDLVVVSYGAVHRLPWLAATSFGLVVLDEAQAIKNPAARQTRAVKVIRSRVRLALTGTPVENRAGDLWSIFDFVNRSEEHTSE